MLYFICCCCCGCGCWDRRDKMQLHKKTCAWFLIFVLNFILDIVQFWMQNVCTKYPRTCPSPYTVLNSIAYTTSICTSFIKSIYITHTHTQQAHTQTNLQNSQRWLKNVSCCLLLATENWLTCFLLRAFTLKLKNRSVWFSLFNFDRGITNSGLLAIIYILLLVWLLCFNWSVKVPSNTCWLA